MKEIYFYPGRFQPMGPHHAETFNTVMSKYGAENSYIVTSNKVDFSLKGGVPKSPLNFQEKKAIMVAHGIPGSNIVQVSNPYYVKEVLFNYKPEEVEAVYLVGAKDMAEDPRFKKTEGVTKDGYKWRIEVVPHVDKCIGGEEMCGTSTRVALKDGDEKVFKDIMGWFDQDIFNNLKKKLNNKDIEEDLYNPEDKVLDYMRSSEYKAGYSKDYDIPRAYKYKRGGMYNAASGQGGAGTMYETRGGESELHIYDFDDTIAQVKANIRATITSPKGDYERVIDIPSDKFPEVSKDMETKFSMMDFNYDFSEFDKQIEDAKLNDEVLNKVKDSLNNPSAQTTILTARTIGHPVTKFLQKIGLNAYVVPLGLQVGGERVTGADKANWIEKKIKTKKTIKKVYFIDDSAENRKAVYTLRDNYPEIEFKIETPPPLEEMMGGTMNKQEKAKHDKSMKRLNKDLKKINKGNQYVKVPKSAQGTLTRKLYEFNDYDIKQWAIHSDLYKKLSTPDAEETYSRLKDKLKVLIKIDPENKEIHSQRLEALDYFYSYFHENPTRALETNEVSSWDGKSSKSPGMWDSKPSEKEKKKPFPTVGETKYGGYNDLENALDKIKDPQEYRNLQLMLAQNRDEEVIDTLKRKGYMKEVKLFSQNWWKNIINEVLLTEGGAAGHMNHPFDDRDLTFAEMKELVHLSLQGKLNIEADVTEKTDGQNLAVTYKNGKVGAARNKATIREPMDIDAVASKFEGRGDIEKAFTFSMQDLESALKDLNPETLNNIFQNGKRFLNIEIIYPATKNVITYGPKAYVQFHGVDEYNLETATKGESFPEFAPQLQKLIAGVNAHIQKTFEIIPPRIITTKAVRDFDKKESYYINKINKLQQEFSLKDSDKVVMYHQKWWENKINNEFPNISDEVKNALVRRWAYFEKSFRLNNKTIPDSETLQKAIDFDKESHTKQNKENVYQFEKIFLELGTDVLSNIDSYLAVNPKDSVKELRKDIRDVIKQVQSSNDLEVLDKLKYQLKRIEDMGGFNKLVPSEGIVFIYKGKTYKLTGLFAAVNQLLGLTKYV